MFVLSLPKTDNLVNFIEDGKLSLGCEATRCETE